MTKDVTVHIYRLTVGNTDALMKRIAANPKRVGLLISNESGDQIAIKEVNDVGHQGLNIPSGCVYENDHCTCELWLESAAAASYVKVEEDIAA